VRSFQAIVIASLISSREWNSRSFRVPFNIPKSQKSHGLKSREWSECDNRAIWCLSNFETTFDPLWHIELSVCTQKIACGVPRRKFQFSVFKSGNT
jgi:hypothetical protein